MLKLTTCKVTAHFHCIFIVVPSPLAYSVMKILHTNSLCIFQIKIDVASNLSKSANYNSLFDEGAGANCLYKFTLLSFAVIHFYLAWRFYNQNSFLRWINHCSSHQHWIFVNPLRRNDWLCFHESIWIHVHPILISNSLNTKFE